MQPRAPISRAPIRPACTFGTTPLTISPTTSASTASAWGARRGAGRTTSSSAGRWSSTRSAVLVRIASMSFQRPTTRQRVADAQGLLQVALPQRRAAAPHPEHGQPVPRAEAALGHRLADEPRVRRDHGLGHADLLRPVGEVPLRERQGFERESLLELLDVDARGEDVHQQDVARLGAPSSRRERASRCPSRGCVRRRGRSRRTSRAGRGSRGRGPRAARRGSREAGARGPRGRTCRSSRAGWAGAGRRRCRRSSSGASGARRACRRRSAAGSARRSA